MIEGGEEVEEQEGGDETSSSAVVQTSEKSEESKEVGDDETKEQVVVGVVMKEKVVDKKVAEDEVYEKEEVGGGDKDDDNDGEGEEEEEEEEEEYELEASGCARILNVNGGAWAQSDGRDSYRRSTRSGELVYYGGAVVTARISTGGKAPPRQILPEESKVILEKETISSVGVLAPPESVDGMWAQSVQFEANDVVGVVPSAPKAPTPAASPPQAPPAPTSSSTALPKTNVHHQRLVADFGLDELE